MKKTNENINATVNNATTTTKKGDNTMKKSSKKSNKVRASKKLYFGKVNIDDVNLFLELEPVLRDARANRKKAEVDLAKAESIKLDFYQNIVRDCEREFELCRGRKDWWTVPQSEIEKTLEKVKAENERLRGVIAIKKLEVIKCQDTEEDLKKLQNTALKKYGHRQDTIITSFNTMQWDVFDDAVVDIFESVGVRGLRDSMGELNANTLPLVQSFTHIMNLRANNQAQCKKGVGLVKELFKTLAMVLVVEGYAEYLEDGARIKIKDEDYSFDFSNYGIQF